MCGVVFTRRSYWPIQLYGSSGTNARIVCVPLHRVSVHAHPERRYTGLHVTSEGRLCFVCATVYVSFINARGDAEASGWAAALLCSSPVVPRRGDDFRPSAPLAFQPPPPVFQVCGPLRARGGGVDGFLLSLHFLLPQLLLAR